MDVIFEIGLPLELGAQFGVHPQPARLVGVVRDYVVWLRLLCVHLLVVYHKCRQSGITLASILPN